MICLIEKRNNQMTYAINKAAKLIIEHAIKSDVGKIIIGYNEGFKDILLNDQYNQWSKSIPIARLRDRIISLAAYEEIETVVINADLNAALNILRKGKPEAGWIGSRGWNTPKRTYLFSK
ncbi:MAG: hypothetical protein RQ856_01415 [Candidatus Izemoplasmatales bacterium]|nr:hypothetical protein [Candidatus Izemoplasmatales bacterium]